jgi:DNA-binding transcriptional MerR regulator
VRPLDARSTATTVRCSRQQRRDELEVKPSRAGNYENRGVIDLPTRTTSGYRDYDADVLTRLTFIRSAQAIGLTLAEIDGALTAFAT